MSARRAQHEFSNGQGPDAATDPLRVILVGRTGLDARLRLDPQVELVRVKTALEAIGELSDPLDEEAPRRSVVIVSAEAEPGRRGESGAVKGNGPAETTQFVSALRHLDPQVRILRLANGDTVARGDYDGVISADASADALRAMVRGMLDAPAAPSAVSASPAGQGDGEVGSLIDAMLSGRKPAAMSEAGDEGLVRLLLQGRDILDPAVEIIRRRLPGKDIVFVTAGRTGREKTAEGAEGGGGAHEAAVSWRGRLVGRLRSRDVPAEQLAPHAHWLASWMALRDQHVQLRDAAFTDPLTGAYNRRFFDHFLGTAIEQARKDRRTLTVLVFDIDNFKQFNDRHGHAAGDEILIHTVKLLQSVIRPTDKVCRIGGDEFVVIFYEPAGPRTPTSKPPENVFQIAQRFQREICNHKFPKLGRDAPGPLTISGGLATYPWDGGSAADLLARADELALQSKREGKNVIKYGPGTERECGGK